MPAVPYQSHKFNEMSNAYYWHFQFGFIFSIIFIQVYRKMCVAAIWCAMKGTEVYHESVKITIFNLINIFGLFCMLFIQPFFILALISLRSGRRHFLKSVISVG